jgi:hypothetical protein
MSTLREVAQQALNFFSSPNWGMTPYMDVRVYEDAAKLRDDLRAALAQEEQEQGPVAWTDRELELIDGMIEVQLRHAAQCDGIANRPMAERQKGWDMERVALLRKIKSSPPRREWRSLSKEEIHAALPHEPGDLDFVCARAIEDALKEKNNG